MKIRILQHMVGTIVSYQSGDIVDMPDQDARLAISAGIAVPVDDTPAPPIQIPEPEIPERSRTRSRRETR